MKNTEKEVVKLRRYFHQNPELSFEEHRTARYISNYLTELGNLEVFTPTETSVVGRLKGKQKGKKIALRADIDALPITEENDVAYASKRPGKMHACGHDGHTAMLLGTAKVLSQLQDEVL